MESEELDSSLPDTPLLLAALYIAFYLTLDTFWSLSFSEDNCPPTKPLQAGKDAV